MKTEKNEFSLVVRASAGKSHARERLSLRQTHIPGDDWERTREFWDQLRVCSSNSRSCYSSSSSINAPNKAEWKLPVESKFTVITFMCRNAHNADPGYILQRQLFVLSTWLYV